jgi:RNA polymerase sigma-70 factor (ECF subfamily)
MDELVERARAGDVAAVEALLSQLAPRIQRFGRRLCGNAADADDVLQETLLSVAQHLGDYHGRSSLSSWVFALTRSACVRRRRGLKNMPARPLDEAAEQLDGAPNPETHAAEHEVVAAVVAALDGLPVDAREVLVLRDVEGLTAPETAAVLEISVEAVKSRLHRARAALRERLRPVFESDTPRSRPDCPDVASLWSRKLDGDLSQLDCARMEAHLSSCPGCAAACSTLKRELEACRGLSAAPVPKDVQARVKAAVRAWARAIPGSSSR